MPEQPPPGVNTEQADDLHKVMRQLLDREAELVRADFPHRPEHERRKVANSYLAAFRHARGEIDYIERILKQPIAEYEAGQERRHWCGPCQEGYHTQCRAEPNDYLCLCPCDRLEDD